MYNANDNTTSMSSDTHGAEGHEDMEQPVTSAEEQAIESSIPTDTSTDDVTQLPVEDASDESVPVESSTPAEDETPTEVASSPTPEVPSRFKRGDLTSGTITKTSPTSIEVDLGDGATGVIPGRELERLQAGIIETLQEGQQIDVYVVNPNDHNGNVILSVNRALEEMDWKQAIVYSENGEVYKGNIAGYNKGGLIVRFGRLRGFVPQSQIGDFRRRQMAGETPEQRYGAMVNDQVFVKVMEVDRARNRLILSERAAAREVREQRKTELIDELTVGQIVTGKVVSLEDFGAFVDVGGAEGLVHLTEITWKHITHPREALSIGQEVTVEIISVDSDRKRIGLSMRRQEADPWDEVATTYQVGDLVQAVVTKMTKFGAFASLVDAQEIEGLIHISELSDDRVTHPKEVVTEDEKLTLRVVKIDVKNRRLGLSLKRVNSAEYLDRDMQTFASDSDD
jgi:small subunit ribosomal protein S1